MFMPLDGNLVLILGEDGEHEVELGVHDVASFPPGVMRGFRNPGVREVNFLVCVGGPEMGKIKWPREVIEKADEDERGKIVAREMEPAE